MESLTTEFFLVEVNERGDESPLAQNFANGFMRTETPNSAFKFENEEEAKQACSLQNMLAKIFKSNIKTYYVKQSIERTKFDETGKAHVDHDVKEDTE
ncbi:MAG: hypothetical protein Q4F01_05785 [Staphylococcus rostri]|uniref:hypothetical protein n=1 Tax=Staphylococcus rostri TaxID=522262 RepID=UPI0026E05470|nr:hypothetical protein [Staphylococcus rostri]MDO5375684.1 hypothetical protein [Staphylococcus rostri]